MDCPLSMKTKNRNKRAKKYKQWDKKREIMSFKVAKKRREMSKRGD